MVWEKEVLEGLKEDGGLVSLLDYSHKTKTVAECFRPVRDLTDDDSIKEYLPDTWISLIKVEDHTPTFYMPSKGHTPLPSNKDHTHLPRPCMPIKEGRGIL